MDTNYPIASLQRGPLDIKGKCQFHLQSLPIKLYWAVGKGTFVCVASVCIRDQVCTCVQEQGDKG